MQPRRAFPEGYLWGAGTSALQHEGSPLADGAGQSIMYRWAHAPGRVPAGQDFDVSADFYRRFRDDVGLMRQLGLRAYNFQRLLPDGRKRINPRGLDFYDALLEAEIAPLCNLYVFDHPTELEDRNRHGRPVQPNTRHTGQPSGRNRASRPSRRGPPPRR
ncbi:glycosyl hydrolase family protein [Nonomuraea deserti]|uniref:Glycosyl hydrolase family protein n=1 Tax=Nonomuraea deserti TaxID=1848322 RepID=A0A4R4VRQ9_9ACTN|nr:glycosyl hydrolase family protein [Nonomuraea deserti]